MSGIGRFVIFASGLMALIVLQSAIVQNAEKISERFAPAYTPMTKQEMLKIYSGYFDDRTFGHQEQWEKMRHESLVEIASLTELHRRAVFYKKYVNENTKLIENVTNYTFGFLYFLTALLFIRHLYGLRYIPLGFIQRNSARFGFGNVISSIKVRAQENEYSKIRKLHENGLISDQEFEKRKAVIVRKINENLR
ncbi:hypothetical protein MOLA814_00297 [Betaproteobacteria bacterium MOLA814]|nr:hypothetical protein MOLA814_00297 [Betaproteobacteria bacterium MOLA814]